MEALIDWLSFTVKEYEGNEAKPKKVIEDILQLDVNMFQLMTGGYGYKKQYFYNNIKVYFDGRKDMGVHVQISGQGIRYLESQKDFNWKDFLYMLMNWFNTKITRLDIAIDDMEGIIDLELLEEKMKSGEIIARWRFGRPVADYKLATGEAQGKTLYFGNRKSDMMCRFYDKKEQMRERYEEEGKELPAHWVRCEIEMHADRANNFAMIYYHYVDEKGFGTLFAEVLNSYMRVVDRGTDSNRSRWENCEMWNRFILVVEKLKLTCSKQIKKLEDSYMWLKKSVSPTIFMLFKASGGDLDFLMELVKEGAKRISKKHHMMMAEYENRERGELYTLEMHQHEVEEKIYNTQWHLAELDQYRHWIVDALKEVWKKKSVQWEQVRLV